MNKEINSNGFGYVDLNLPSGTLWAWKNVGAASPDESGLYFQWGDTQGYTADQVGTRRGQKNFSSYGYKWNPSGDGSAFTKYKTEGDVLELDDDAAHANMGGDWHMPTPEQCQELIDNTTSEWATQDGVNGRLFTSKKDSSKSIFIPAAGFASDGSLYDVGNGAVVWSSALDTYDVYDGQYLSFSSNSVSLYGSRRYYGFSVRGVIG